MRICLTNLFCVYSSFFLFSSSFPLDSRSCSSNLLRCCCTTCFEWSVQRGQNEKETGRDGQPHGYTQSTNIQKHQYHQYHHTTHYTHITCHIKNQIPHKKLSLLSANWNERAEDSMVTLKNEVKKSARVSVVTVSENV